MASRRSILAMCLVVAAAACGGGGGGGGRPANPAASATFTYPPATGATMPFLASDAVAVAASLDGALTADGALLLQETLFAAASGALGLTSDPFIAAPSDALGRAPSERFASEALPLARQARAAALTAPGGGTFATGCYTATATTVTFRGCTVTETSTDGTSITVSVDGQVTGAPGTAAWELSLGLVLASPEGRISARYDDLGSVTVTPTTAKARQDTVLQASVTFGRESDALALGQIADLDVVLDAPAACATRIVDGTFEAKRVWIRRPGGATSVELPDVGVKYSWDGCDAGTFQLASR
jgi:hypothetical protein